MRFVIFGLTVSSSWGNGHATLWRGLCAALAKRGHKVVFFEKDQPYYAAARDMTALAAGELIIYPEWKDILPLARKHLSEADVAIITSYCPDAPAASELILDCKAAIRCFYDLDTPVTLDRLERGLPVSYIGDRGLRDFDLALSYSGGRSLDLMTTMLGARRVAPLYGSVDPDVHFPVDAADTYRADLSYLGTFAAERQERLERLFVEPARQLPAARFLIGGSMYDAQFPWLPNIHLRPHVPPPEHPAFYCSTRLNLNVTRESIAVNGYCPSGRLFEAAACASPLISDNWAGLDEFFEPNKEILLADTANDIKAALEMPAEELQRIGRAARERALEEHTADVRARELESILTLQAA